MLAAQTARHETSLLHFCTLLAATRFIHAGRRSFTEQDQLWAGYSDTSWFKQSPPISFSLLLKVWPISFALPNLWHFAADQTQEGKTLHKTSLPQCLHDFGHYSGHTQYSNNTSTGICSGFVTVPSWDLCDLQSQCSRTLPCFSCRKLT